MMKKLVIAFIVGFTFLAGCAGSPYRVGKMSPNELETVTNEQLLRTLVYREHRNENVINEILNRELLTEFEVQCVVDAQVQLGLSERAVRLIWGSPDEINRTVVATGERKQYVYNLRSKMMFIYFEDGIVTAIQD